MKCEKFIFCFYLFFLCCWGLAVVQAETWYPVSDTELQRFMEISENLTDSQTRQVTLSTILNRQVATLNSQVTDLQSQVQTLQTNYNLQSEYLTTLKNSYSEYEQETQLTIQKKDSQLTDITKKLSFWRKISIVFIIIAVVFFAFFIVLTILFRPNF